MFECSGKQKNRERVRLASSDSAWSVHRVFSNLCSLRYNMPSNAQLVTVSRDAVDAFCSLDESQRIALFERVIAATRGDARVYRPEVARQRRLLEAAGVSVPDAYGRCVCVCRAWTRSL